MAYVTQNPLDPQTGAWLLRCAKGAAWEPAVALLGEMDAALLQWQSLQGARLGVL